MPNITKFAEHFKSISNSARPLNIPVRIKVSPHMQTGKTAETQSTERTNKQRTDPDP